MGNNKKKKKLGAAVAPFTTNPKSKMPKSTKKKSAMKKNARFSCQQEQRFQCHQQKNKEEAYHSQVRWERARKVNSSLQIVQAAELRVWLSFSFLPNLALSIHKNAQEIMGDTSPGCYFLKATNKAFHDLTGGKSLAPATTSLLGLSLNFIPTPHYAPSVMDIAPTLDCIERDVGLKTFFSGHDQVGKIPILHAKSS